MSTVYSDGSYVTQQGYALLAKCSAEAKPLKFVKVTAGNGIIPSTSTPDTMIDLNSYVTDGIIASKKDLGGGEYQVDVQISTTSTEDGFNCSEIMLWAENPDDVGGTPIGYTYFSLQQHPEWIRPNAGSVGKFFTVSLITIVSGAPVVDATINPSALVTAEMLEQAMAGVSGAILAEITIPTTAWTVDETSLTDDSSDTEPLHPYYADVTVTGALATHFPIAALHTDSVEAAYEARMAPTMQALAGEVRFWAKAPAKMDLSATLALVSGSEDSQGDGYGVVNASGPVQENVAGAVVTLSPDSKIPSQFLPGMGFVEMTGSETPVEDRTENTLYALRIWDLTMPTVPGDDDSDA